MSCAAIPNSLLLKSYIEKERWESGREGDSTRCTLTGSHESAIDHQHDVYEKKIPPKTVQLPLENCTCAVDMHMFLTEQAT